MSMEKAREDKSLLKEPLPKAEEKILSFWKEQNLLEKIETKKSPEGKFIFYEGPPTANGRPAIHHLVSRAFKDVVLRYKTMRGFHVRRRGGWDTHGLPVEIEVEKQIGIKSKKDIEAYGVAAFNEKCKESAWTYIDEWQKFTERMGYLLDQKNAYITYKPEYIESVWSIVGEIAKQNLLYKDYKVVPWCPRCGTALSSHELAQGYEDIKDLSLYIKFPVVGEEKNPSASSRRANTYLLAWTTTPWTLPGHVALAVGKEIDYVKAKSGDEFFILAEERTNILPEGFEIVREIKGKDLINLKYEPPFSFLKDNLPESEKEKLPKAFQVYEADFVNTKEGTGIVHTAVMYGQDDFELGTKVGLPKFHLVDETGHFIKGTGFLEGRSVNDEALSVDILKDLDQRNLLFKKENYQHSYPFCWRCGARLIYYARDSWYIAMSKLRDKLISENKKIHWEPDYIKRGRFGEWLNEVKDWAISRERYWGTPLPVWESKDGEKIVVDSVETLKKYIKSNRNTFFFARHSEAETNAKGICSSDSNDSYGLTDKGRKQAEEMGKKLKNENITSIYVSPYLRTRETAKIICNVIDFPKDKIIIDERIHEYSFGDFNGKPFSEFLDYEAKKMLTYDIPTPNGESYLDAKKRFGSFVYDTDKKHSDETILVVTHGIGAEVFQAVYEGASMERSKEIIDTLVVENADMSEYLFTPLPHDKNFELDLHKPFIDDVVLVKNGKEFKRVKEVMDVWFDSGAMPFAQDHYPFENKKWVEGKGYPADYICEAIDQTRGWFYTLHAIGCLMGRGRAYKNVICLGLLLDKEGKKMSKSTGNIVDPWQAMEEFGADPLRFWMYAAKESGEPKNFDPESVKEMSRKVFALLTNVYSFYEMYGVQAEPKDSSKNILDRWILARLSETNKIVTGGLEHYRIVEAVRAIRDFVADFSQWYIRRSRERFKEGDEDARTASQATRFVLHSLARIMAPFTPFYAEMLWQSVRVEKDMASVHLADWPKERNVDEKLIAQMNDVRNLVSKALEQRSRANIKIRQPLRILKVKSQKSNMEQELIALVKDEMNVKEVIFDEQITEEIILDTTITPELKAEGDVRELLRTIQEKRKEMGLVPNEPVRVKISASQSSINSLKFFESFLKKHGNIKEIVFKDSTQELKVERVERV